MAISARKSTCASSRQIRPVKKPVSTGKANTTRRSTRSASHEAAQISPHKRGRPLGSGRATSAGREADPVLATQPEAINNEIAALRGEIQDLGSGIDVLGKAVDSLLKADDCQVPSGQEKSSAESPPSPGTLKPNANSGSYPEVPEGTVG
jgi:hypothetical protein